MTFFSFSFQIAHMHEIGREARGGPWDKYPDQALKSSQNFEIRPNQKRELLGIELCHALILLSILTEVIYVAATPY